MIDWDSPEMEPYLGMLSAAADEEDLTLPQYLIALARNWPADKVRADPATDVDFRTAMDELESQFPPDMAKELVILALMDLQDERSDV